MNKRLVSLQKSTLSFSSVGKTWLRKYFISTPLRLSPLRREELAVSLGEKFSKRDLFRISLNWGLTGVVTLLFILCAKAETITGKVISVVDGDTIRIQISKDRPRIRLRGIDAPERCQAFYLRARRAMFERLRLKTVSVEFEAHDQYGRLVGKVLLDGKDMNLEMIRLGMAWYYNAFPFPDKAVYQTAQEVARKNKLGLWGQKEPIIPPWDYRATHKKEPCLKNME